jgi:outer membrane protein assembly factor BamB
VRPLRALGALLLSLIAGCSSPLVTTFTASGDAPSRTGLTALGDGAVFGNDAGRVLRLDGTGRTLWVAETGAEIELSLAVSSDDVVAAVVGGDVLVALDGQTGRELWRAAGQPPAAALAAVGERLLLLGREGELRAFAARTGGLAWRRGWNTSLGLRPGLQARALLGLVATDADLLALGPVAVLLVSGADGTVRWKAPARVPVGVAVDGDGVWVAEQPGRLLLLDRRSGAVRRSLPLDRPVISPPALALGRVWVGLDDGSLLGVDTRGEGAPFRAALPGPMVAGVAEWQDRVLVPTSGNDGRLLAIDPVRPGSPATARVDSPLRTRPLAQGPVAWQLASDGRVLGFRLR